VRGFIAFSRTLTSFHCTSAAASLWLGLRTGIDDVNSVQPPVLSRPTPYDVMSHTTAHDPPVQTCPSRDDHVQPERATTRAELSRLQHWTHSNHRHRLTSAPPAPHTAGHVCDIRLVRGRSSIRTDWLGLFYNHGGRNWDGGRDCYTYSLSYC